MEALDLLEKRIDSLNRVLGPIPDAEMNGAENFVDSLLSANTLLTSSICSREKINNVINRSDELENYLDPNFLEKSQQVRTKEVYLNAVAPELQHSFDQFGQIKSLESTLGAEYFRNIPDCTDKLKEITKTNSEFAQQTELLEESLVLAMKRYGEIQSGLMDSLAGMNKRLEAIEITIQKKKRNEDEAELPLTSTADTASN